jgi:hypothetical protein
MYIRLFHLFSGAKGFSFLVLLYKTWIIFFIFCILSSPSKAQNIIITDTVEYAKEKAYEKNFTEADRILTAFNNSQTNLNALQLHSQVLFWMKEFDRSIAIQQLALAAFPEDNRIKLEYGNMLFDMGRYKLSENLLNDYLIHDNVNAEALMKLAYINLWSGRNNKAKTYTTTILQNEPGNTEASIILEQIKNYTSPYIHLNAGVFSDDQPLTGNFKEFVGGWYHSWILSPVFSLKHNTATVSDILYNSTWIQLMNSVNLNMGKTKFVFKGGVFNQENAVATGALYVTQKIAGNLAISAGGERRPYQYTISSVKQPLLQDFYTLSLDYNKNEKWLGKAAFEMQQFDDNNRVQTSYVWMLLPLIHKEKISVKGGYGFNYSTSLENRFILKDSSRSNGTTPITNKQLEGVYDPYFTPQNQIVHSVLASININPSKNFSIALRSSIGVSAKADAPSFAVKQQINQYSIYKTYNIVSYNPVEAVAEINMALSPRFSLKTAYAYNSLFFYTSHLGSIGLKYSFNP